MVAIAPREARHCYNAHHPFRAAYYFAPEHSDRVAGVGPSRGAMAKFPGRSAPFGTVGSGVVTAAFYNFHPDLVALHIPRAWKVASLEAIRLPSSPAGAPRPGGEQTVPVALQSGGAEGVDVGHGEPVHGAGVVLGGVADARHPGPVELAQRLGRQITFGVAEVPTSTNWSTRRSRAHGPTRTRPTTQREGAPPSGSWGACQASRARRDFADTPQHPRPDRTRRGTASGAGAQCRCFSGVTRQ